MSPLIITLVVLLGVVLLLALWLMGIYNGLVVAANRFKNAFAQIDVQLKRRYERIPNLVEAVKGSTPVIRARNSAPTSNRIRPRAPTGCRRNDITLDHRGLVYLIDRIRGVDLIETRLHN